MNKKTVLFLLCALTGTGLAGQKKQRSEAELNDPRIRITDPVLRVAQWQGATVELTSRDAATQTSRRVSVDVATGAIVSDRQQDGDAPDDRGGVPDSLLPQGAVNPVVSPDGAYIAFTRDHDLYTFRLSDRRETRLTFDGCDAILNGHASWVYMEEILGRAGRYRAFWWSPDSRRLAFFRFDDARTPLITITDSPSQNGYVETWRYPKAGQPLPSVRAGIVSPDGGAVVWAKVNEQPSDTAWRDDGRAPQEGYLGTPRWRPDSRALWLQWLDYGQNHYRLLEVDLASGATAELYEERQDTWVAIDDEPRICFLESGHGFIMKSDKSGWSQLYLHDMDGRLRNPITAGSYTVLEVLGVDEQQGVVYFTCYKDHVGCVDFYRVGLDGTRLQRLSFGAFSHRISLSDDKRHFITIWSNVDTPPKVALYRTDGSLVRLIQDTKNAHFETYERPATEFVTLRSDDGQFVIPLRITWPLHREAGRRYPVRLAVYGGPGALTVRNEWTETFGGDAFRLSRDGLIQVAIDHRGSGHNGKVGMAQMYRRLGYWELKDYAQGVRWLAANGQADTAKILISGYSYGGYIACYALTAGAGVFTHGVAGGSVTDWALYDAAYAERYMDTPAENPDGYRQSSVLAHADRLQGRLLIAHGLRDENVHAQHTFQFIALLQDLQKSFELMIYPESRHGNRGLKKEHSDRMERAFIYRELLAKPCDDAAAHPEDR
ncbi:MAG: S9 family peptidase [Prevotellaceae bacterium]|jgi:dipeptidyl-peptidase-4|nr:S9 family peptidase [Prevotellaceae bacterium]